MRKIISVMLRAIIPGGGSPEAVNPIPSLCLNPLLADQAESENPRTRRDVLGQVDSSQKGTAHL